MLGVMFVDGVTYKMLVFEFFLVRRTLHLEAADVSLPLYSGMWVPRTSLDSLCDRPSTAVRATTMVTGPFCYM